MQCSCGGMTYDRTVQRDYKIVGEYARCSSRGRIYWWRKPDDDVLATIKHKERT